MRKGCNSPTRSEMFASRFPLPRLRRSRHPMSLSKNRSSPLSPTLKYHRAKQKSRGCPEEIPLGQKRPLTVKRTASKIITRVVRPRSGIQSGEQTTEQSLFTDIPYLHLGKLVGLAETSPAGGGASLVSCVRTRLTAPHGFGIPPCNQSYWRSHIGVSLFREHSRQRPCLRSPVMLAVRTRAGIAGVLLDFAHNGIR